jgi:hypothetical protein
MQSSKMVMVSVWICHHHSPMISGFCKVLLSLLLTSCAVSATFVVDIVPCKRWQHCNEMTKITISNHSRKSKRKYTSLRVEKSSAYRILPFWTTDLRNKVLKVGKLFGSWTAVVTVPLFPAHVKITCNQPRYIVLYWISLFIL